MPIRPLYLFCGICAWSVLFSEKASAQIAIGEWREHFPYGQTVALARDGEKVFCATNNAIFSLDRTSGEIERFSKVNALSDVNISTIAFNPSLRALVVAYQNGNLDIIRDGVSWNLSDIKRSDLLGDKGIYDIHFDGDLALLGCGFGIVVVDLVQREVRDTWLIAPGGAQEKINSLDVVNDSIYAATDIGLFAAWRFEPNLVAFTSWRRRMDIPQPNGPFNLVEGFGNTLVVNNHRPADPNNDTLYYFDGQWNRHSTIYGLENRSLHVPEDNSSLVIAHLNTVDQYDPQFMLLRNCYSYYGTGIDPAQAITSVDGKLWIADRVRGLGYHQGDEQGTLTRPNGPKTISAYRMSSGNGGVYVTTGSVGGNWSNTFKKEGVHRFLDGSWSTLDRDNTPLMGTGVNSFGGAVNDFLGVVVDPEDADHAFIGSWEEGLLEIRNGALVEIHNNSNSSLLADVNTGPDVVRVSGVDIDENGDLWICNSNTNSPIAVRTATGTWRSFPAPPEITTNTLISDILAASNNTLKWVIRPRSSGMMVFTDGGTLTDPADDQYKALNTFDGSGELPSMDVFCMAEDLDGEIWVGTGKGPAVFYNPDAVFGGGDFDAQQILIEQDGNVQILLETEAISTMAVDGANRKWLGTQSSGVYLLSPDGTEQIHHFTQENSPLPSNTILSMTLDQVSGEIFFGTDQGIVSYRGSAIESDRESTCAKVFPNPVYQSYSGPIAITGLARDSDVKITDVSGNLVYRTTSLGGQAIWPGTDLEGNRVSTGIYLVFASDSEGKSKCNTKLMVVR